MLVLKKFEVPLCDIAMCSEESCDVPDYLLHDKSPLKCEKKKKNYNDRKEDTTKFQLQGQKTDHYELKRLKVPLCDITLCSSVECDTPGYILNSKSISHPINANKDQKNYNIRLTESKQHESDNQFEEDSSSASEKEFDTKKKNLKQLSSSEEETATKKKKLKKAPSNEMGIGIKRRRWRRKRLLTVRSSSEYSSTEESESEFSPSTENDSEEDYSYQSTESEGSSFSAYGKKKKVKRKTVPYKKKTIIKKKKVEKAVCENNLSEFEKMVRKNRADKLALLKALKMDELKEELIESIKSLKPKRKPKLPKSPQELLPVRKSERESKVNIDLSEDALYYKSIADTTSKPETKIKRRRKVLTRDRKFEKVMDESDDYTEFIDH